jgi:methylmalonyl-CoA mutase
MTGTSELTATDSHDPSGPDGPDAMQQHLELAAGFPEISRDQWETLVAGVLSRGGATIEPAAALARLTSATLDKIAVQPLYTEAPGDAGLPGVAPYLRGATPGVSSLAGWDVRARFSTGGGADLSESIQVDLENGVTSLWLTIADGVTPGIELAELGTALEGVYLDLAPIVLDAGARTAEAADALLNLVEARGIASGEFVAVLGADPIGLAARSGQPVDLAPLVELAARISRTHPQVRAGVVDGTVFHEAGASEAQQLAFALAVGVAYLRALTADGISPHDAARQLEFRYGVTDEQFLTIALLRAARRLWSQVTEASGVTGGVGQLQHAVTSWSMLTRHDPAVNILRGTLAAFGAGVGGAHAVTVQPFDEASGAETVLSRRVARNTSTLLIEESNIGRVVDPGGGSYYIESLSDDLAKAAWAIFQETEKAGGIVSALASGWVAEQLAATRATRDKTLAQRRAPLTGVSEFPNLLEPIPAHANLGPRPEGALPRIRYSEVFEALRDRSEAYLASTGARPKVVLATIGALRDYTARVGFASGALAPGGIDVVEIDASDADALAAAFASGITVACLCSSDGLYGEQGESAAAAVLAAGAKKLYLAGRPARDREAPLREAGVNAFLYMGSDIVAAITDVLDQTIGSNFSASDDESGVRA